MTSAEQETQSGGGGGEMCQRQWKRKRTEEEEDDDDRYTIAFSSCVRETVVSAEYRIYACRLTTFLLVFKVAV